MRVALVLACLSLLVWASTVHAHDYSRYNRVHRAQLLDTLADYQIVSIRSTHFAPTHRPNAKLASTIEATRRKNREMFASLDVSLETLEAAGLSLSSLSLQSTSDWSKLASAFDKLDTPVRGSSAESVSLAEAATSAAAAVAATSNTSTITSSPGSLFTLRHLQAVFNARLAADNWGGWSPTELAELSAGKSPLPWSHGASSEFTFTVENNEAVTVALERNDKLFASKYKVEQQVWKNGKRMRDLEPRPKTLKDVNICWYHGHVKSVSPLSSRSSVSSPSGSISELSSSSSSPSSSSSSSSSPLPGADPSSSPSASPRRTTARGRDLRDVPSVSITTASSHTNAPAFTTSSSSSSSLSASSSSGPVAMDTCHGGFTGFVTVGNVQYAVVPALNVLSQRDIAIAMASITNTISSSSSSSTSTAGASSSDAFTSAGNTVRDVDVSDVALGSLHVVYRMDRDSLLSPSNLLGDMSLAQGSCGVDVANNDIVHNHHHDDHDHSHDDGNVHSTSSSSSSSSSLPHSHQFNVAQTLSTLTGQRHSPSTLPKVSLLAPPANLYVKLYLASDNRRCNARGQAGAESDATAMANNVAALYTAATGFNSNVYVILVAQTLFTFEDPWTVTLGGCEGCSSTEVSVSDLLSKWHNWRSTSLDAPPHDNGHLLSEHDFQASVLGYAGLGVMCSHPDAGGIDETRKPDTVFNSAVLAHELGHNFFMLHDGGTDNACPTSGFIMNAVIGVTPTQFSSCSATYFNNYTASGAQTCMLTPPTTKYGDDAVCGNGFIEKDEQCDCGSADCSTRDPCCNGATCKFVPGAQCSRVNPCCDATCAIRSASANYVCRPASSACDLPEVCNGIDAKCPSDLFLGAGTPCTRTLNVSNAQMNVDGACYLGTCNTFDASCLTSGSSFQGGPYLSCGTQADLNGGNFCATQYCRRTSESSGTCYFFTISGQRKGMDDGLPCGTGKQCYSGKCVGSAELSSAYRWSPGPWGNCTACGDQQTRNLTCTDVTGTKVFGNTVCPPSAAPPATRLCQNTSLFCLYRTENTDAASTNINFFGYTIPKSVLIYSCCGGFALYVLLVVLCYRTVTKPVGGIKNMFQKDNLSAQGKKDAFGGRLDKAHGKSIRGRSGVNTDRFSMNSIVIPPPMIGGGAAVPPPVSGDSSPAVKGKSGNASPKLNLKKA